MAKKLDRMFMYFLYFLVAVALYYIWREHQKSVQYTAALSLLHSRDIARQAVGNIRQFWSDLPTWKGTYNPAPMDQA
jgi:hypothetical protein